ncbi:protein-glutamate O-methyltransferase CheR [Rhodocytophaga aerolata]|uniref:Protein-glutamate O-methyltransferase CheR n=1 Tax=Rhodocytophaga aerolata TaxID=455078 RepID=A0ABT8RGN3_9BACT|nr:protein-glutamate O-methyltransferase CheR [Rhodocytophaga aerolata]MDO1451259.1 protein-glutamate O-methyltransferase CheR [Rhodocytophaga aerolata]
MYSISDEELNSITKAVFTRYGIDFTNYEPVSLKRRIARILAVYKLENVIDLWRKIIYEKEFIQLFIDEVTVGLTEMFRNHDFWIKLREDIFSQLKSKKDISIWHAGCSTGEEVYSMAICLTEEGLISRCTVIATDLNSKSIEQAKQGRFSSMYAKAYASNYLAAKGKKTINYYHGLEQDEMVFNKLDLQHFTFHQHNLVKDLVGTTYNLILCRNVMIYFDETLKMKILDLFHKSLKEDGFLAIGYYDSLPEGYKKYFSVYDATCKIYKKKV